MSDTVFDLILRGEIPCAKIFEDDALLSFMDAFPQSRGHALIVPKRKCTSLFDIDGDSLTAVVQFSRRLAVAQRKVLQADGIRVCQFNGAAAGQTVFYYHMHLIPMWEGKSLASHGGGMADMAELTALAAQLREAL
ncbi:MAG: HIT family protein [Cardiobacteriaceae bacterium]|nr:HIT family protein [Cardiobacteriaceae bacterium]